MSTEIYTPPLTNSEYLITQGEAQRYPGYSHSYILVSWDPIAGCTGYNLYRALQQGGEYELIAENLEVNFYLDGDAQQFKGSLSGLDYVYKVAPKNSSGIETPLDLAPEIPVVNQRADGIVYMPQIVKEILRRHELILKTDGIYADIYVRKVAGDRCDCYDPYREAPNKTCLKCYGTGIVGGFVKFENQLVRIAQGSNSITIQRVAPGISIQSTPSSWILNYPILNIGTVIVEKGTNKRWLVTDITKVFVAGFVTRQEFKVLLVKPSDILYKLGEMVY